jgi:hypothetical protein
MIERAPQKEVGQASSLLEADEQYGRNELAEFFYLFHSFCIFR